MKLESTRQQTGSGASVAPVLADPCPPKTRADLEWDKILEALAARCVTPPGRRLARSLPFAETDREVIRRLAEVREATELDRKGEPLPIGTFGDVASAIERARIGATLSSEEIRSVGACLGAARTLRKFLHGRASLAPALFDAFSTDPTLDDLERELVGAFDADGTLSDRSSPRLEELRSERRTSRDRLVRRLEELIKKHEGILQDSYWTERGGRYVLPVRSDAHERFPGIVHASSESGATIFVEPRALVPMGNRQKMLEAQVAREEQAVYVELSAQIAEAVHGVEQAERALGEADVRAASCRLTEDLRLTFPEIVDTHATIELRAARHPLLSLDGVSVVPSDLSIEQGRAMIISGPNAGGKTVALKTLGLSALMVRAGLPVPAREGSRMSVFEEVLTDVGDDQNLRKNLSTFSAHVQNLAEILDKTRARVLVLLDELAGGTDPREGEALAMAVLDSLCARGGSVVCTTHYDGLKALPVSDPRFDNASVGFDFATMSPTFRLVTGVPGSSSALAVARRFGIPNLVLERAEKHMSHEALALDKMLQTLEAERKALSVARDQVERETEAARDRQRALDRELEIMHAKERALLTKEGESILAGLRRARDELASVQARLRKTKLDDAEIRAATKSLDAVAQKVRISRDHPMLRDDVPIGRSLERTEIKVGLRVHVPRLRADAEIMEILPNGQLRVAAGALKLVVSCDEIRTSGRAIEKADVEPRRPSRLSAPSASRPEDRELPGVDNSIDLRGLRSDEAVAMAEQFLDRSLGAGRRTAFLIHGHGTGALREAVREALRTSAYVERLRSGEPHEGGEGVTVVALR